MKILIITQAVDPQDTALGFFIRWIRKISERAESVEVICLRHGVCVLPENVTVYSLTGSPRERTGSLKKKKSRFTIAMMFFRYIFALRSSYDIVFVHMNQEYVLLGGLAWKALGKKIFFWRNHPRGDWKTRLAVALSHKVFYTAEQSFTARFKNSTEKAERMPAGIDTDIFRPQHTELKTTNSAASILVFGRITPIKRVDRAIKAVAVLMEKNLDAQLTIVGDVLPRDSAYMEGLHSLVQNLEKSTSDRIHFQPGVPFEQAAQVYHQHDIFLNCTESGSFDKTIIEALACGMRVVTTNESMKDILPAGSYAESTSQSRSSSVISALEYMMSLDAQSERTYESKAAEVVAEQSLDTLMERLFVAFGA